MGAGNAGGLDGESVGTDVGIPVGSPSGVAVSEAGQAELRAVAEQSEVVPEPQAYKPEHTKNSSRQIIYLRLAVSAARVCKKGKHGSSLYKTELCCIEVPAFSHL